MSDNPGGIPKRASVPNKMPQEVIIPSEELMELPSVIIVRRVRTHQAEPVSRDLVTRRLMYIVMETARNLSIAFVAAMLLVVFIIQRNNVNGPSMEPNLYNSDSVIVEMISKYFTTPQRGDIMTVNATGLPGYSETAAIVKRVIGLPGETVTIRDGLVYINGVLLDEPYLGDDVQTIVDDSGIARGNNDITLGEGEYYFMGDNRGLSLDSRVMGPITTSRIKSHVIAKIYPFNDMELF